MRRARAGRGQGSSPIGTNRAPGLATLQASAVRPRQPTSFANGLTRLYLGRRNGPPLRHFRFAPTPATPAVVHDRGRTSTRHCDPSVSATASSSVSLVTDLPSAASTADYLMLILDGLRRTARKSQGGGRRRRFWSDRPRGHTLASSPWAPRRDGTRVNKNAEEEPNSSSLDMSVAAQGQDSYLYGRIPDLDLTEPFSRLSARPGGRPARAGAS
jgi:hypothetical protein